ncbi:Predicted iron-containing alcohol dehydrogenase [gamma proteobacterium HdN1]|nr:Predicted iron-containing alcohol dehydrogenase [gamma proteobacterium HdN1]
MSKPYFEFFCPVKTIAGHKALEHMPFELQALGSSRPLIITDVGVRKAGLLEQVLPVFKEAGTEIADIYDNVPPDSSTDTVTEIAALYRSKNADSIIAIGGGSVIDTSKGVNILVSEGGDDIHKYSGAGVLTRPLKPLFVVPTTAGTGSEVTAIAVVSDCKTGAKLPFASQFLLPNAAVLDPRMTLTLPPAITAATAMDAMTHAMESYICLAKNPLSDAYGTQAIRKISENILHVMDNPQDANGRLELALAATMAGIAFSNSMVGLVHALGHALGAICHLPHGICMNIFLPYVLEYNMETSSELIGELLLPLAGPEVYASTPKPMRAERTLQRVRALRDELYERVKLPRRLSETGKVTRDQIPQLAKLSLDEGPVLFNPKEMELAEAIALLERAW